MTYEIFINISMFKDHLIFSNNIYDVARQLQIEERKTMHYLTNYYKNLSEQLQDKVNHLQRLIEADKKYQDFPNNIGSPNYDYKKHSNPRAWESFSDIHPDTTKHVANQLASYATRDETDKWDDGETTSDKVPARVSYDPATGTHTSYNKASDAPSGEFMSRSMQLMQNAERNRDIRNQNIKSEIKREATTETGNFDAMSIPAQKKWQNKGSMLQNIQQLKIDTEAARRRGLGYPVDK
jgi:hypothetical protein